MLHKVASESNLKHNLTKIIAAYITHLKNKHFLQKSKVLSAYLFCH